MTLLLLLLLLLFLKSNNNRYGISLSCRSYHKFLEKNSDLVDIIDIRNKERFDESHTIGSLHLSLPNSSQVKGRKLVIVHDSDIELAKYFLQHNLKQFSDNIYQTNMIDHDLKQYQSEVFGTFSGSEPSALIKNNESA